MIIFHFLSGPDFGFDVFSGSLENNETYNSSLDLGMFSDVGVGQMGFH